MKITDMKRRVAAGAMIAATMAGGAAGMVLGTGTASAATIAPASAQRILPGGPGPVKIVPTKPTPPKPPQPPQPPQPRHEKPSHGNHPVLPRKGR